MSKKVVVVLSSNFTVSTVSAPNVQAFEASEGSEVRVIDKSDGRLVIEQIKVGSNEVPSRAIGEDIHAKTIDEVRVTQAIRLAVFAPGSWAYYTLE